MADPATLDINPLPLPALIGERGPKNCSTGRTSGHDTRAAALRQLGERLTAVTDYLASGLRLSETIGTDKPNGARLTETLRKALAEVNRADAIVISLRNLLSEEEK